MYLVARTVDQLAVWSVVRLVATSVATLEKWTVALMIGQMVDSWACDLIVRSIGVMAVLSVEHVDIL